MGAAWLATGVGVTLGWLAALGMGFASEFSLGMPLPLLSAAVAIAITWWMWRHSALRQQHVQHEQGGWLRVVILVALATALLNLMAAGGISHWGVMQTVVVLGVLAPASNPSLKSLTLSSNAAVYVLIALVVTLLALQFTALRPVIGAQQAMSLAHEASSADEAILHLRAAADADPWSAEPFQMLGQLRAAQGRLDSDTWDLFEQALERDQRNPNLWAEMGRWKLVGSKFGADQPLWAEAVQHYRRALALTPRGPWQARLAWVLQFGDAEAQREARQLATAALDWNESHPHIEQRLDRLVLPSPNGTVSAEQAMLNLRNSGN